MATNDLPSYEEIEKVFETSPLKVLDKLPDNTETRSAKRNLSIAYSYAKEAREKVKVRVDSE